MTGGGSRRSWPRPARLRRTPGHVQRALGRRPGAARTATCRPSSGRRPIARGPRRHVSRRARPARCPHLAPLLDRDAPLGGRSRHRARPRRRAGSIFVPPPSDPGAPAWGAGEYRIDLLLGSGDVRRDRCRDPGPLRERPPVVGRSAAGDRARHDVGGRPDRRSARAVRDDRPRRLADRRRSPDPPLDEAAAWLDTEPGSGRMPADRVAVATMPRATGLGVRLADGSRDPLRLDRTARARARSASRRRPVGGGIIDRRDADPWVVFAARRGDAWAPGVYRIDVTWSDAAGLHERVVAHRAATGAVHRAAAAPGPRPRRGPAMPGRPASSSVVPSRSRAARAVRRSGSCSSWMPDQAPDAGPGGCSAVGARSWTAPRPRSGWPIRWTSPGP